MIFEEATKGDIACLTDLRISYLREDLGEINAHDLSVIKNELPDYYTRHLNNDLMAYDARELIMRFFELYFNSTFLFSQ